MSLNLASKISKLALHTFQPPFIGSIDNGTSSTRFIVFDCTGRIVVQSQKEYPSHSPFPGWCEQDGEDIYSYTTDCIAEAVKEMKKLELDINLIRTVGITNQRETTCVWDKDTGKQLNNAIVWLDTRTKDLVEEMVTKAGSKTHFLKKCGLPFSTYFSALKMKWLLLNVKSVKEANELDRLSFGTVDSWLLYKLTGVYCTDVTNASRTMLMDLSTLQWDDELCSFFGIKKSSLPSIRSSSETYGFITSGPLKGIPISGILGDQQAALVGQRCFQIGQLKNTYGTGCFMLCNIGKTPLFSRHGLLTTVAYQLGPNSPCFFAFEGSVAIAGASVKWLRDNLGIINQSSDVGTFAAQVKDTGGVHFVPAFTGLFAPHWRDDAKGTITGLTLYSTKNHICRATLEAVAFQTVDIMDAMAKDMGEPITVLKVDGGMANSDELMQIQADIAGVEIQRPSMLESTALGAALVAGLAMGVWTSLESFVSTFDVKTYSPNSTADERVLQHKSWKKAIQKSFEL